MSRILIVTQKKIQLLYLCLLKNIGINNIPNYCCSTDMITPYIAEKEVILTCHCSFIVTDFFHKDGIDYVSLICEGFLFD